jgi:hypothetical protein
VSEQRVTDPLVGLVARALRTEVEELSVERLEGSAIAEIDRIRWRGPNASGRLRFTRSAEATSVEVQLLPFLSRRGVPVPRVVARGIPPGHAPERRPWILTEDIEESSICDEADGQLAEAAGATLAAIQRATAADEPALSALGVPALPASRIREEALGAADLLARGDAMRLRTLSDRLDAPALEALGVALVHGAFGCDTVRVGERSLIVTSWMRAHLGCPLQDLARLHEDLLAVSAAVAEAALRGYGAPTGLLSQAELLQQLSETRWWSRLSSARLVDREAAAGRIREAIDRAEKLLASGRAD